MQMTKKTLLLLASMSLAVLVVGGVALAEEIVGTYGDDHLDGSQSADEITALGGIDTVDGWDGDDTIFGGPGDDTFTEGGGSFAGNGDDTSFGEAGNDYLSDYDLTGHNRCTGDRASCTGRNTQRGGEGNDWLEGSIGGTSSGARRAATLLSAGRVMTLQAAVVAGTSSVATREAMSCTATAATTSSMPSPMRRLAASTVLAVAEDKRTAS
jgi:hypothetical protein